MRDPPVSPFFLHLIPFLSRFFPVTHRGGVGQGGDASRAGPHGHHPAALARGMEAACLLSRIPATRLRPQTLAAALQEAAPNRSSLYRTAFGDFAPKIRRRPSIDAPWGIPSCCHRNPGEEGEMGGVERADRRAQAPCLSRCS
jgi:hypothetical protein